MKSAVARRRAGIGAALTLAFLAGAISLPRLVGQADPGLTRLDDGTVVDSRLLDGDAIVVVFASWSPRCRDVVSRIESINEDWGSEASVLLVAFQESAEEVREFLSSTGSPVTVLLDVSGSFSKQHGITTLPSLLVLRRGEVVHRGALPRDPASVLETVFG